MPSTMTHSAVASDKQVALIEKLMDEKNLFASPSFFDAVNAMDKGEYERYLESIKAGLPALSKKAASDYITALMALPAKPFPASDKQLVFIAKLVDERLAGDERDAALAKLDIRDFTGGREGTASAFIDQLMAMPKLRTARTARTANLPEVPKGRYAIDNSEGVLTFYHVGERQGEIVIDVKAGPALHPVPFTEAGYTTILQGILDAGVKDAMVRYGKELGCCGKCGRDLTDEHSRAAGIGPICAQGI
jgi:hypothetical protein